MAPGILNKLLELIEGWSRQVWALCLQSILTNSAQGKKKGKAPPNDTAYQELLYQCMTDRNDNWVS